MWLYFLIWKKSNLKKWPGGSQIQQPLSHGSVQGACPVSERFDSSPEPCGAQRGGRCGTEDMGTARCARCLDTLLGQCQLGMPSHALVFFGRCCRPNQWVWNSQWGDQDGFVCVVTPSSPITITEPPLNLPSFNSTTERMDCLCFSNKFLTNHPGIILIHLSSLIRVTSMDSQVLSSLLG